MTKCRITEIKFNNGQSLSVEPDDIVVFVGPNNAGKSRAITDIYRCFTSDQNNVVISDIDFVIDGVDELRDFVTRHSKKELTKDNITLYNGFRFRILDSYLDNPSINGKLRTGDLLNFFVSKMETRDRLSQCDPVETIDKDDAPTHPLHYVAWGYPYLQKLSSAFCKAFDKELLVEKWNTRHNFLRIGSEPIIESAKQSYEEAMTRYEKITATYPKVHEQGDGIKGFVGVLLNLMMENYSVFLMDEPEAFLHHPQAKILGNEIPSLLGDRQAFISTHSEALVRGLLERAPKRLKIVRITRTDNGNAFSILDNRQLTDVWNDSLLKHSNIMESLFYKNVVVCESDSDCMFYSIILTVIKEHENRFPETLFVYSSTKSRLKTLCRLLTALNIDFRAIPDIDVLRERKDIKPLVESCGGTWDEETEADYSIFISFFRNEKTTIDKEKLKSLFNKLVDSRGIDEIDSHMLTCIKSEIKLDDAWRRAKSLGSEKGLPSPEAKEPFNRLNEKFKRHHIHIVEAGELESFIDDVGHKYHGPKWVDRVLTLHPDMDDAIYDRVKEFIGSLNL